MTPLPTMAHQGGWDEVICFLVPVVAALFALRWAEKRARRRAEQENTGEGNGARGGSRTHTGR